MKFDDNGHSETVAKIDVRDLFGAADKALEPDPDAVAAAPSIAAAPSPDDVSWTDDAVAGATIFTAVDPAPTASPPNAPEGGKGGVAPAPALPLSKRSAASADTPSTSYRRTAVAPLTATDVYTPAPTINPVLRALREQALHLDEERPGGHSIVCPWAHEHDASADLGAAEYIEPDQVHGLGSFHCPHDHRDAYRIGDLLEHLGVSREAAYCKAVIRLMPGEMARISAGAEAILAATGDTYHAGNRIVRLREDAETGDVSMDALHENTLAKLLSAESIWLKSSKDGWGRIDPPPRHVSVLLRAGDFRQLPALKGVARQPYLDDRGEVVMTAGYDPKTQMFGAFDQADFPMPDPTRAAAEAALAALKNLVSEFHMRSEHDRSAAICMILTAAMRSRLPLAPAFNLSASTPGSGKSYLAQLASAFAGPAAPMNLSYPVRADEASKAIMTALLPQPAVLLFDDMQTNWIPHSIINKMLTSEAISDRLLGGNQSATVGTRALVLGTGNNREPEKDLRRRVVSIYLSPLHQTPATLEYKGRPVEEVRSRRGLYVAHALTIVRAWIAAGRPMTEVPTIGSFGTWSDLCRQPLLWLGQNDPAQTLLDQLDSDPETETLIEFFNAWHAHFGKASVTARSVMDFVEADDSTDLAQVMAEGPYMDAKGINRHRFGQYLRRHVNRVAGEFQLVGAPCSERKAWAIVPVGGQPEGEARFKRDNSGSNYGKNGTTKSRMKPEIF